jgi:hypothetical protein
MGTILSIVPILTLCLVRFIATVYAIKNAGLAIGIGVGSSFIVLVSFTWGVSLIFLNVYVIIALSNDLWMMQCV